MQAVGELDQDDADVARHREQHLAEALGLRVLAARELDLVEFRHAVDHRRRPAAEPRLDLGARDRRVLHHVVQQRGGQPLGVEAPFRQDARDGERMRDVRLARLAELAAVGGLGELERALDQRDVRRRQVVTEVPGEFGNLRHAGSSRFGRYRLTVGAVLWQHFDAHLAGGDLAQCDDRRLVAVGVDAAARSRR